MNKIPPMQQWALYCFVPQLVIEWIDAHNSDKSLQNLIENMINESHLESAKNAITNTSLGCTKSRQSRIQLKEFICEQIESFRGFDGNIVARERSRQLRRYLVGATQVPRHVSTNSQI
jgi:ribosomal protein L5